MGKSFLKNLLLVLFVGVFIISCKKDSDTVEPVTIDGTWKILNLNVTLGGNTIDYWTFYNQFYPCTKDITISFDTKSNFSVFEPAGCVDDNGDSFLPIGKTGTFTLGTDNKLILKESGGQTLEGNVVVESDKITWNTKLDISGVSTDIVAKFTRVQ